MPYKEKPISRRYFPIEYVAQEFATTTSHIRFIEDELNLRIARNRKGNRSYLIRDIVLIGKVIKLGNLGIPLSVIKRYKKSMDEMIALFESLPSNEA